MKPRDPAALDVTPTMLLRAYALGIFPMAEDAGSSRLHWIEPHFRGVLPLDEFHISASLRKRIRREDFRVLIDNDFDAVIDGCAEPRPGRRKTWINAEIRYLYGELFRMGHCHTIEVWRDDRLLGGLYGVRLGGTFFGESMFHRESDASKIALSYLVARLKAGGFELLDTQFLTKHLTSMGAIEVPRLAYKDMLEDAIAVNADWHQLPMFSSSDVVLQLVNQTS